MSTEHDLASHLPSQNHIQEEQETQENRSSENSHINRKKRLIRRGVILGVIILVLVAIFIPRNRNGVTPQNPIVAKVGSQPVYLADIQNVALEQYDPKAVDKEALRISYDILIERIILGNESRKLGIVVTNEEIIDKLEADGFEPYEMAEVFRTAAKYALLKDKITKTSVQSREAYSIGFYIATYDEQKELDFTPEEKALINRQRLEGKKALAQIEQKLRQGELPLTIAKTVFKNYPSLRPIIAVNGYVLEAVGSQKGLENPKIYTYDEYSAQQPFFNAIYSMTPEEIRTVENQDGSGGNVIQIKSINPTGVQSYENWLENKKKELVEKYRNV